MHRSGHCSYRCADTWIRQHHIKHPSVGFSSLAIGYATASFVCSTSNPRALQLAMLLLYNNSSSGHPEGTSTPHSTRSAQHCNRPKVVTRGLGSQLHSLIQDGPTTDARQMKMQVRQGQGRGSSTRVPCTATSVILTSRGGGCHEDRQKSSLGVRAS